MSVLANSWCSVNLASCTHLEGQTHALTHPRTYTYTDRTRHSSETDTDMVEVSSTHSMAQVKRTHSMVQARRTHRGQIAHATHSHSTCKRSPFTHPPILTCTKHTHLCLLGNRVKEMERRVKGRAVFSRCWPRRRRLSGGRRTTGISRISCISCISTLTGSFSSFTRFTRPISSSTQRIPR